MPTFFGCPLPEDRDGDEVADGRDACPDAPGLPGLGGCPAPAGGDLMYAGDEGAWGTYYDLGSIAARHPPADWDGHVITVRSSGGDDVRWFQARYRLCAGSCEHAAFPAPELFMYTFASDTRLIWRWEGDRAQLEGYRLWMDGNLIQKLAGERDALPQHAGGRGGRLLRSHHRLAAGRVRAVHAPGDGVRQHRHREQPRHGHCQGRGRDFGPASGDAGSHGHGDQDRGGRGDADAHHSDGHTHADHRALRHAQRDPLPTP